MGTPEKTPGGQDTGPSNTAIAGLHELRQHAIAMIQPLDLSEQVQNPIPVTNEQLRALARSFKTLQDIAIYQDPSKEVSDRPMRGKEKKPFSVFYIANSEKNKREPRVLILECDDGQSPFIRLSFHRTAKSGSEFDLYINFGFIPEISMDEPVVYDSGRKKRGEMDSSEYDVSSDLLERAERVFPHDPA